MTHVTCRLTAKNRDQLQNPTLSNRAWTTFIFNHTELTSSRGLQVRISLEGDGSGEAAGTDAAAWTFRTAAAATTRQCKPTDLPLLFV